MFGSIACSLPPAHVPMLCLMHCGLCWPTAPPASWDLASAHSHGHAFPCPMASQCLLTALPLCFTPSSHIFPPHTCHPFPCTHAHTCFSHTFHPTPPAHPAYHYAPGRQAGGQGRTRTHTFLYRGFKGTAQLPPPACALNTYRAHIHLYICSYYLDWFSALHPDLSSWLWLCGQPVLHSCPPLPHMHASAASSLDIHEHLS